MLFSNDNNTNVRGTTQIDINRSLFILLH